jgi:hypothetical protein
MALVTNLNTFVNDSITRVGGHKELIVRGVVQALRPAIRQLFEIQQLQEDSVKDTGRMTGFSLTAAKSRLCRPRAALNKSFGALTNDEFFRQRQAHVHVSWHCFERKEGYERMRITTRFDSTQYSLPNQNLGASQNREVSIPPWRFVRFLRTEDGASKSAHDTSGEFYYSEGRGF